MRLAARRGRAPLQRGRRSPLFISRRDFSRRGVLETVLVRGLELGAAAGRAALAEGERRSAWSELESCILSFRHFRRAGEILGLDATAEPLERQIEACSRLDRYRALWSIEGLGFLAAERALRQGREPSGLLAEDATAALPAGCMVPLHAGMGLSLANSLLRRSTPRGHGETAELIARFRRLCQRNSTPGCGGVAFEMLGFLLRSLRPELLEGFDRALRETAPELVGFLWHGAGRSLYFSFPRAFFVPGCGWRSLGLARSEPPHEVGRRNAVAGFALGLALVNVRQPEVVEQLVRRHGAELDSDPGAAAGIFSAGVIWHAWAGPDRHLDRLCAHRPEPADERLARWWQRLVVGPCRLARSGPGAEVRDRRFGDLFDVDRLADHAGSL